MPGLKAFVAAVLGGIGVIPGAMIGGLLLGVAETFTKAFISAKLSDAIAFAILLPLVNIHNCSSRISINPRNSPIYNF